MQPFFKPAILSILFLALWISDSKATTEIESHGIIWTFSERVTTGTFLTGDPWVIGPVEIIGIRNTISSPDFEPRLHQNGSMINPLGDNGRAMRMYQGYDDAMDTYRASLNAGLPNGQPVSPSNPVRLGAGDAFISSVSWLYRSVTDSEPGTPRINRTTGAPRPLIRAMGILTVLHAPPPANSFRPPYVGKNRTVEYTLQDVNWRRLENFRAPSNHPDPSEVARRISRPWVDHVFEWSGAMLHPSMHMPNYGRDMGNITVDASLLVHLDIPTEQKRQIAINLIQMGIDFTGIADNGGGWRANGGHGLGRKWPILFTGLMLENQHMMNVGQWPREFDTGVEFQEDQQHFHVTQAEVDLSQSSQWSPDSRNRNAGEAIPYTEDDLGLPRLGNPAFLSACVN